MRDKKNRLAAVEHVAVLTATAVMFIKAAAFAAMQRGYFAIGGEFMLLLLPIIYYVAKREIRDFKSR